VASLILAGAFNQLPASRPLVRVVLEVYMAFFKGKLAIALNSLAFYPTKWLFCL
jgi:hypothetical protein